MVCSREHRLIHVIVLFVCLFSWLPLLILFGSQHICETAILACSTGERPQAKRKNFFSESKRADRHSQIPQYTKCSTGLSERFSGLLGPRPRHEFIRLCFHEGEHRTKQNSAHAASVPDVTHGKESRCPAAMCEVCDRSHK